MPTPKYVPRPGYKLEDPRRRHDESPPGGISKPGIGKILPSNSAIAKKDNRPNHHSKSESMEACLEFLSKNIYKNKDEININEFKYQNELRALVSHMILTNLSGWRSDGDILIHESGRIALKDHWELLEDGHLSPKINSIISAKYRQLDLDKLYKFMEICNG